jgi:hypothetical protein
VLRSRVDWQAGRAWVAHEAWVDGAELVRAVEEASQGTRHRYRATVVAAELRERGAADDDRQP